MKENLYLNVIIEEEYLNVISLNLMNVSFISRILIFLIRFPRNKIYMITNDQ